MAEIAELGLSIDSRPLVEGHTQLDRVSTTFRKAQTSADGFTREARQATNGTAGLNAKVATLNRTMGGFYRQVIALAGIMGTAFSLGSAIGQARELSAAIGELGTLLPGAADQVDEMTAAGRRMGVAYGNGSRAQIQAFYAAVSAGATDAAEATARVDAANRLAIGGVADLSASVAILSASTNAYAAENLTAADASDILFTGVRTGVTTISELSAGLGRAIPIASALGVGLDELVGGVAALTTQGQSTELAVTGIRAALNATLQPSQQAAALADQLGISFNSAAVESMGFLGFMEHVAERTGGSRDALTTLFGSVEAGTAVLSLAGQGGVKFAEIMGEMEARAGATDAAFERVAQTLDQRMAVQLSRIADGMDTVGTIALQTIVPAMEAVTAVLSGAEDRSVALEIAMKALAVTAGVTLVSAVGSAGIAAIVASEAYLLFGMNLGRYGLAAASATLASNALGAAVRFALGPIGLAITAVGLLTAAWVTHRSPVERLQDEYSDLYDQIELLNGIQGTARSVSLGQARARLAEAQAINQTAEATGRLALETQRARIAALQSRVDAPSLGGMDAGNRARDLRELATAQREFEVLDGDLFEARYRAAGNIELIRDQIALLTRGLTPPENAAPAIRLVADAMEGTGDAAEAAKPKVAALTSAQLEAKRILEQMGQPVEDYTTHIAALNTLLAAGSISQDQFNRGLRETQSALLQANVDSGNATWTDGILAGLDAVGMKGANIAASLRDSFAGFYGSIAQGAGDAFGRAIVFGENFGDAIKNVAANAVAQLISSLVQMGIQWLINAAIGEAVGAAATAASVAQGLTVAAAWAPAAAAVSLASFGANSIPAAAGIASTYALSSALSALGGFESGGYTGSGGTSAVAGVVHGQEFVMNAGATSNIGVGALDYMNRTGSLPANDRGGNDNGVTVNIGTINAGSDVSREELNNTVREATTQAIVQSTRISAKDTNAKMQRLARPQISAGRS